MSRILIPVQGMRCEGCEHAVQSALLRLEGVRDAKADRNADRVRVSFDPERIDEPRLRAEIAKLGYQPFDHRLS